jgi:hypothetical protein
MQLDVADSKRREQTAVRLCRAIPGWTMSISFPYPCPCIVSSAPTPPNASGTPRKCDSEAEARQTVLDNETLLVFAMLPRYCCHRRGMRGFELYIISESIPELTSGPKFCVPTTVTTYTVDVVN